MLKFALDTSGLPGPTTRIAVGDNVDNLADEYLSPTNSNPAVGALITAEVSDIRFTLGGDITTPTYPPTQGVAGLGHILYEGQSIVLTGGRVVNTFQFIALTNGVAATIQVTPLFNEL